MGVGDGIGVDNNFLLLERNLSITRYANANELLTGDGLKPNSCFA